MRGLQTKHFRLGPSNRWRTARGMFRGIVPSYRSRYSFRIHHEWRCAAQRLLHRWPAGYICIIRHVLGKRRASAAWSQRGIVTGGTWIHFIAISSSNTRGRKETREEARILPCNRVHPLSLWLARSFYRSFPQLLAGLLLVSG